MKFMKASRVLSARTLIVFLVTFLCATLHAFTLPAVSQIGGKWQELTELQRAERVIRFACLKGLVNELVKESVAVTKQYEDGDPGFRVSYKRYENQNAWVDLDAGRAWSQQEDRDGYFTVRRASITNIAHFSYVAFLVNANRADVRRFFLTPEYHSEIVTRGNVDVIPGGSTEIAFEFLNDQLRALTFDCSL